MERRGRLLTFLGTGRYERVRYLLEGRAWTSDWVAEALVRIAEGSGASYGEVLLFGTAEAQATNWSPEREARLREAVESVRVVTIPHGRTEAELWTIFSLITEEIQPEETIDFDITHGFRSLPLLALIVAQYGAALKGSRVNRILYGAYEAGSLPQGTPDVRHPDAEAGRSREGVRTVPVFDLSAFGNLMEWTLGIDRFLTSSDAGTLCRLTQQEIKPVLVLTKGRDQTASALRGFVRALDGYTSAVRTCRGRDLLQWEHEVRERLAEVEGLTRTHVPALTPLLGKLRTKLPGAHAEDDTLAALNAAEWCWRHDLVQQGLTILEEAATTFGCTLLGLDPRGQGKRQERRIGGEAIVIAMKGFESKESRWGEMSRKDPERTRALVTHIKASCPQLLPLVANIKQARNDINHSGFSESRQSPEKLRKALETSLKTFQGVVDSVGINGRGPNVTEDSSGSN